jgi:hypothetical protein
VNRQQVAAESASRFQACAVSVLSYLILLGGLITVAIALYMVIICYTSLPWSDGWTQIFAAAHGENLFSLKWLWQQHNEHRLLIPKLLLALDLRLFHASQKLLLSTIFLVQLLHWWLLSWSMRSLGGWHGPVWRTGTGLAAFCLFSPTQWENLVWGFQTCFVLSGLFATLAFVGLLLYWRSVQQESQSQHWELVVLSVLAALGGLLSLANGLLLLPLLLVAALLLRLRYTVVSTYLISALASTALYFHNYVRPAQNSDPAASLRSPIKLVQYVAVYFGSVWGYGGSWTHHNLQVALVTGAAGLGFAAVLLLLFPRIRKTSNAFAVELVLIILFCIGTAFVTALGRVASGNSQAFASRYQTIALLFWWCLGCLLLLTSISGPSRASLLALQIVLALVFLRGADLVRFPLRDAREHAFQQRAAAAALISDVDDREQIQRAFPDSDSVLRVVPFMGDNRLSIFHQSNYLQFGSAISSAAHEIAPEQCRGEIQTVSVIENREKQDLRITGWAWSLARRKPASYIVGVADGKVIGLGAAGDWRPTIRAVHSYLNTSFIGFTAYAKGIRTSQPVNIYAIFDSKPVEACYLATVEPSRDVNITSPNGD